MTRSGPKPEAGRQPERTRLAWQRTTLAAVACLVAVERLTSTVSPAAAVVLAALGVVALGPPVWVLVRRSARRDSAVRRSDGLRLALLSMITTVAGVAALTYALT